MAETLGSLVDKICIFELKRFHMQEQIGLLKDYLKTLKDS